MLRKFVINQNVPEMPFLNFSIFCCSCCSVSKLCPTFCDSMDCNTPGFPVLHYLPEFAQTQVHWVGDTIQLSHTVALFSSCPQSFPASGSFPMSRLFTSGGQSIGASASATVLPMNIQSWFPLPSEPFFSVQFSSVVCECSVMSNSLWPHGLQPTRQEY